MSSLLEQKVALHKNILLFNSISSTMLLCSLLTFFINSSNLVFLNTSQYNFPFTESFWTVFLKLSLLIEITPSLSITHSPSLMDDIILSSSSF